MALRHNTAIRWAKSLDVSLGIEFCMGDSDHINEIVGLRSFVQYPEHNNGRRS
jgi:hypothetical protein